MILSKQKKRKVHLYYKYFNSRIIGTVLGPNRSVQYKSLM